MNISDLTDKQLMKLNTKEAKDIMFNRYKNLISYITRKFSKKGVPYEDLFQEACLGFLKSLEKYDINSDAKFSVYTYRYMEGYLKNALKPSSTSLISVPDKYYTIFKRIEKLQKANPSITKEEIKEILNIDEKEYEKAIKTDISICSYNIYIEEADDEYINLIEDPSPTIEEVLIEKCSYDDMLLPIYEIIFDLDELKQDILTYSYGLFDADILSIQEISDKLNIPYQSVLNHKNSALRIIINTLQDKSLKAKFRRTIIAESETAVFKFKAVKTAAQFLDLNEGKIRNALKNKSYYGGFKWTKIIIFD